MYAQLPIKMVCGRRGEADKEKGPVDLFSRRTDRVMRTRVRKAGRMTSSGRQNCADRGAHPCAPRYEPGGDHGTPSAFRNRKIPLRNFLKGIFYLECGRRDLNPHDLAATRTLILLVYQFQHFREQ